MVLISNKVTCLNIHAWPQARSTTFKSHQNHFNSG